MRESFLALEKIKFESSSCFLGMGNLGENGVSGKRVSFFFCYVGEIAGKWFFILLFFLQAVSRAPVAANISTF